ncbi:MAG: hypoxanthine-guanine phosphoribosyltransferase [Methylovulum sp.]|uniref:hypoxanthine-guanine phosphoribosyltransferase n=1 Tax=Methylovulum sp. TaxID=1916980 RepID=UPI0026198CE0|nr:hypoxanthine-guanine phosphoribosyltransferase [Methylovulum sp.]MDD2722513.1 hypoxanthine-guanine phosphoribosyltransferase [Methylovulum sp.]MDD5123041.1 hypoxanthine-guanine phosphoribosyltransferase [Methylovulum sp.]
MLDEIKRTQANAELLHSEQEIEAALDSMAVQINTTLADSNPIVLCVINGGIVVAGKLLTRLTMPLNVDSINASRYRNQTAGGAIEWLFEPRMPLDGRVVLVVDDILDEGITLAAIHQYCLEKGATAVYSAVLLDKLLGHDKPIRADFVGLEVANHYLFGYGMDYKGYLRNAAGIYACKLENQD